ncbi:hypothetical protein BKA70DRAFT_1415820 [Coprinopsis sp. MPI-PUGE-AT-0042]|nr:hypothetical protein BKA70DRAFT_1415820 [Coprinopsis sp. MPI-PUGE-AT-0042]
MPSARPAHRDVFKGTFTIDVPVGWHAIVTAISRKPYLQALEVEYDIISVNSRVFASVPGKKNEVMKITLDSNSSMPIKAQPSPYTLKFGFYHSPTGKDAEDAVDNNDKPSANIHVVSTGKRAGSKIPGPENVTFFVFVEDTDSQEANSGRYDDAVTMVYFVEQV